MGIQPAWLGVASIRASECSIADCGAARNIDLSQWIRIEKLLCCSASNLLAEPYLLVGAGRKCQKNLRLNSACISCSNDLRSPSTCLSVQVDAAYLRSMMALSNDICTGHFHRFHAFHSSTAEASSRSFAIVATSFNRLRSTHRRLVLGMHRRHHGRRH